MTIQSGLSSWVLAIVTALKDQGTDTNALMTGIKMNPDKVGDTNYRYSQEQVSNLWKAAVESTGDLEFGLKVARYIRPSTFHVVGYAMSCSSTLKRSTERFVKSARLISDSALVELVAGKNTHTLTVDLNIDGNRPIYQTIDTMMAGFFMLSEWILTKPIIPVAVTFKHGPPKDVTEYNDVFRCEVEFNSPTNSVVFNSSDLTQAIPSANEELAIMLDEMTSEHLSLRYSSRFSRKVREALILTLPNGQPTKGKVAKHLAVSERTLLRRLRDEGTNFQDVLDRLRENLAYDYLNQDDLTIDSISYLLGFSSVGTFSRAFLRWTGRRPSIWRSDRNKARVVSSEV